MAITIVKGADTKVTINLTDERTGDPFDLTGFTSASAFFAQNGVASPVVVTGMLHGSPDAGRLDFQLDKATSALLQAGDGADMEVRVDQGSQRTIIQFQGQVDIKEELF